jgi:prevent-host-death family protein
MRRKDAEEARNRLPELLAAAERGHSTIITRQGRPLAVLAPIAARGAGGSVWFEGKLFRESHGIGEDLVTIRRGHRAGWQFMAAWAAPHDGAAGSGNNDGFAAPGRFVLGICLLCDIGKFGGINDGPVIERR